MSNDAIVEIFNGSLDSVDAELIICAAKVTLNCCHSGEKEYQLPVNTLETQYACWRRGSVVSMSVFGWQTFPDLCLIYA